jgi:ATPase subunit of ABC transporter with duplicated ATPase domains
MVNAIYELESSGVGIKKYAGNFDDYLEQKIIEQEQRLGAFTDQQEKIEQLRSAAAHLHSLMTMKKGGKATVVRNLPKPFLEIGPPKTRPAAPRTSKPASKNYSRIISKKTAQAGK